MRLHQIVPIMEGGRGMPCVVVDVQPEYSIPYLDYNSDDNLIEDMMKFLNHQTGPILLLANLENYEVAEDYLYHPENPNIGQTTDDSLYDIEKYWDYFGFDWHENHERVTAYNKGFWYLRSWIDAHVSRKVIIQAIREMYRQKVTYSSNLRIPEEYDEDGRILENEEYDEMLACMENYAPIQINWLPINLLKQHSPCYLMGGYEGECLAEVEIMMNAFNIRYKKLKRFIY